MSPISSYDKKYQAEDDVNALQRAGEVQQDPKRHAAAKKHAKTKLQEHDDKRKALEGVVGKGLKKAFPNKKK
jgi:hypothetical protein